MTDVVRIGFGLFFIVMGALAVVNHPIVDKFNRFVKSFGTTHRPRDIEMSRWSILIGRIAGVVIVLYGVTLVLQGS